MATRTRHEPRPLKHQVELTSRREHLAMMRAADRNVEKCWDGFYLACNELAEVAGESKRFGASQREAAVTLKVAARIEGALTQKMIDEFARAYKQLGAPGDFGYDLPEGQAMQAVYEWWTQLHVANRK